MSKASWWLIAVVAVGVVVRGWGLTTFPPSLNWDEVSLGYNAYSLLKTGKDEWGQILPTIFRAYGDYKLPVYVYLAVVSQAILGLGEVAVRLPSLVAGVGLVVFTYVLAAKFLSSRVATVAAFLVAVSPWTVWLSRIALEANVGAFIVAAGMYYLLSKKYTRAILLLGISVWSYNSARIFVPAVLLFYVLINRRFLSENFSRHKKSFALCILIFALFFLPMFWQLARPVGQARYQWLSLLDSGAVARINQLQSRPGGRLVYNKATYFGYQFIKNYLTYFSPSFLFLKGGTHYQFSLPNHGLLYPVLLPFFYLGIWSLIKNSKFKIKNLLLLWLLLAPIAGSITRDSPHVLRAVVMLPLPMVLTAYGLERFGKYIKWAFFFGLSLSTINYLLLTDNYRRNYSWSWQYGYKPVVQFIKQRYSQYDQVVFTKRYGEPHEFVAFFWPWNPAAFVAQKQWDYHDNWYWVDALGKFRFVNDWEMLDYVSGLPAGGRYLMVASPDAEPPGREVYRVNFLDNKPAFIIKEL